MFTFILLLIYCVSPEPSFTLIAEGSCKTLVLLVCDWLTFDVGKVGCIKHFLVPFQCTHVDFWQVQPIFLPEQYGQIWGWRGEKILWPEGVLLVLHDLTDSSRRRGGSQKCFGETGGRYLTDRLKKIRLNKISTVKVSSSNNDIFSKF